MIETKEIIVKGLYYHRRMNIWIDTTPRKFHGYTILFSGEVLSKKGIPLSKDKRERRGGGYDLCVRLYYNGGHVKWTLQRLVASCFLGNIDGKQVNHDNRNTDDNSVPNLDIMTGSQNQNHWRNYKRDR